MPATATTIRPATASSRLHRHGAEHRPDDSALQRLLLDPSHASFGPHRLPKTTASAPAYTSLCNMTVGYRTQKFRASVDFLNLFDSKDHNIDYYYTSRLPGEPAGGVDDLHFHPVEPLNVHSTWRGCTSPHVTRRNVERRFGCCRMAACHFSTTNGNRKAAIASSGPVSSAPGSRAYS